MLKTLFKKQMYELNAMFFVDRKSNKHRSKLGTFLYLLLYLFIFVSLALAFFGMSMLFVPIIEMGKSWLYFSFTGIMAIFFSSLLNMFIANSYLFNAKDNDLLLSLPIKPSNILLVRMFGLYAWGLLYETVIFLPTVVSYWITAGISVTAVIYPLIIWIVASLFVLALSVGFGWIVALISSRLKNKSILTVLIAVLLIGVYYFFYFRLQSAIASLIANIDKAEQLIKGIMIPFYHLGLACEGSLTSLIIFIGISVVLFALAYYLVSKNFISIVTRNVGNIKKEYKEETSVKQSYIKSTLIKKELKHFTSSTALMLNTGLGLLIIPIGGIVLMIKANDIRTMLDLLKEFAPEFLVLIPSLVIVIGLFCLSLCCFTATTISLEGKNMWITKTLPIDYREYYNSKIKTQVLLFTPSALIFGVLACLALKLDLETSIFVCATLVAYLFFLAVIGLFVNIKKHNFEWTTETYVVKQSAPVAITMFGGWVVTIIYAVTSYFLMKYTDPFNITVFFFIIMMLVSRLLLKWILTDGVKEIDNM